MMNAGFFNLANLLGGETKLDSGTTPSQSDLSLNIKGIVVSDGEVAFSNIFDLEAEQAIDFSQKPPIIGLHRDVMPPVVLPLDAAKIGKEIPIDLVDGGLNDAQVADGGLMKKQLLSPAGDRLIAKDLLFVDKSVIGGQADEIAQTKMAATKPDSPTAKINAAALASIHGVQAENSGEVGKNGKLASEQLTGEKRLTGQLSDEEAAAITGQSKADKEALKIFQNSDKGQAVGKGIAGELDKALLKQNGELIEQKHNNLIAQESKIAKGEMIAGKTGGHFEQIKSALSGQSENKNLLNESIGQLAQASASKKSTLLSQAVQPVSQHPASQTSEHLATLTGHSLSAPGKESSESSGVQQLIASSEFTQGLNLKRQFAPNLAMRIQWMFNQTLSSAEILMDPPEMGPLSVKLQHHNGETSVLFQVANLATKEALDDNLSRLKEMLAEQGILLGEAQVKHQEQKSHSGERETDGESGDAFVEAGDTRDDEQTTTHIISEGIVDVYS